MKKISKAQWIAVGVGVLVIVVFFTSGQTVLSLFMSTDRSTQQADKKVDKNNNLNMETPPTSGKLEIQDIVVGTGLTAESGKYATVNYIGAFTDGRKFDSSYDSGRPINFQIGSGELIPGFDKGIIGMKVGGKRRLIIPPDLAYGKDGYGPIPPNTTLIFEIDLVEIK